MSQYRLTPSRKGDYHLLIGPYDADLVREIKAKIPQSGRQWDPTLKAWRIRSEYVETAQRAIDNADAGDDGARDANESADFCAAFHEDY